MAETLPNEDAAILSLTCGLCPFQCDTGRDFVTHNVHNHRSKFLPCALCNKLYSNSIALIKHVRGMHTGNVTMYHCGKPSCNYRTTLRENFIAHLERCIKDFYTCFHCRQVFASPKNLLHHMQGNDCPHRNKKGITKVIKYANLISDPESLSEKGKLAISEYSKASSSLPNASNKTSSKPSKGEISINTNKQTDGGYKVKSISVENLNNFQQTLKKTKFIVFKAANKTVKNSTCNFPSLTSRLVDAAQMLPVNSAMASDNSLFIDEQHRPSFSSVEMENFSADVLSGTGSSLPCIGQVGTEEEILASLTATSRATCDSELVKDLLAVRANPLDLFMLKETDGDCGFISPKCLVITPYVYVKKCADSDHQSSRSVPQSKRVQSPSSVMPQSKRTRLSKTSVLSNESTASVSGRNKDSASLPPAVGSNIVEAKRYSQAPREPIKLNLKRTNNMLHSEYEIVNKSSCGSMAENGNSNLSKISMTCKPVQEQKAMVNSSDCAATNKLFMLNESNIPKVTSRDVSLTDKFLPDETGKCSGNITDVDKIQMINCQSKELKFDDSTVIKSTGCSPSMSPLSDVDSGELDMDDCSNPLVIDEGIETGGAARSTTANLSCGRGEAFNRESPLTVNQILKKWKKEKQSTVVKSRQRKPTITNTTVVESVTQSKFFSYLTKPSQQTGIKSLLPPPVINLKNNKKVVAYAMIPRRTPETASLPKISSISFTAPVGLSTRMSTVVQPTSSLTIRPTVSNTPAMTQPTVSNAPAMQQSIGTSVRSSWNSKASLPLALGNSFQPLAKTPGAFLLLDPKTKTPLKFGEGKNFNVLLVQWPKNGTPPPIQNKTDIETKTMPDTLKSDPPTSTDNNKVPTQLPLVLKDCSSCQKVVRKYSSTSSDKAFVKPLVTRSKVTSSKVIAPDTSKEPVETIPDDLFILEKGFCENFLFCNVKPPISEGGEFVNLKNMTQYLAYLKSRKSEKSLQIMSTNSNFFKCMFEDCAFTCNCTSEFQEHCKTHAPSQVECAYCLNIFSDAESLIQHSVSSHRRRTFQCSLCFYRACSEMHICYHLNTHHMKDPGRVITGVSIKTELANVPEDIVKIYTDVKIICCPFPACSFSTNSLTDVLHHVWKHPECLESIPCTMCSENSACLLDWIAHLKKHSIYLMHCLFCAYGCNKKIQMLNHLVVRHADYPLMTYVRTTEHLLFILECYINANRAVPFISIQCCSSPSTCYCYLLPCPEFEGSNTRIKNVLEHVRAEKMHFKAFICLYCQSKANSISKMEKHLKTEHDVHHRLKYYHCMSHSISNSDVKEMFDFKSSPDMDLSSLPLMSSGPLTIKSEDTYCQRRLRSIDIKRYQISILKTLFSYAEVDVKTVGRRRYLAITLPSSEMYCTLRNINKHIINGFLRTIFKRTVTNLSFFCNHCTVHKQKLKDLRLHWKNNHVQGGKRFFYDVTTNVSRIFSPPDAKKCSSTNFRNSQQQSLNCVDKKTLLKLELKDCRPLLDSSNCYYISSSLPINDFCVRDNRTSMACSEKTKQLKRKSDVNWSNRKKHRHSDATRKATSHGSSRTKTVNVTTPLLKPRLCRSLRNLKFSVFLNDLSHPVKIPFTLFDHILYINPVIDVQNIAFGHFLM